MVEISEIKESPLNEIKSLERAVALVHSQMGPFSKKKVSPDSRLFHDLGIDGDAVIELLLALNGEYGVLVDDFNFSNYFGSEIGAGWRYWHWRLFHKNEDGGLKAITVRDLAWAIEHRKMIGPEERK
jgi:acyl carrier protein